MFKQPEILPQHLVVFTRFPEPGITKTRLIPFLGAEGAANLQRQMTEHTITQIKDLQISNISVEICFAGGDISLMQAWLGDEFIYQPQGDGDLGERMMRSLTRAFNHNAVKVIIIGTDCPDIDTDILTSAFTNLDTSDLVLGPAVDGGYYLIGLRYPYPELFVNINWGTSRVFQQTIDIARKLNLSVTQLIYLTDIDHPEDLVIWEKRKLDSGYSGNQ
jgi:rSAM/selenodomain-associated transferase 1